MNAIVMFGLLGHSGSLGLQYKMEQRAVMEWGENLKDFASH